MGGAALTPFSRVFSLYFGDCLRLFYLWVVFTCVLMDEWIPILNFYIQGFSFSTAHKNWITQQTLQNS